MTDRDLEINAELRFYRDLFAACCALQEAGDALDDVPSDPEAAETVAAWSNFWGAYEEVCDFVRTEQHADAMEAAGVTCNDLHHGKTVLAA